MPEQFGKYTRPLADSLAASLEREPSHIRLLFRCLPCLRDYEKLDRWERGQASAWACDHGTDPAAVWYVSFTLEQAAEWTGTTKQNAGANVLPKLTNCGALAVVGSGVRGHATLYAVAPWGNR